MRTLFSVLLLAILAPGFCQAQVDYLDHQHMDFRLQYHPEATGTNQFDLRLGFDSGVEHFVRSHSQVYIVGNTNARLALPANPNFSFLGPAGAPIWILPQSQNTALPYLGTSAEDLPNDTFDGPITLELRSVEGPGNFFAWANSGAGQPPIIKFIATNGVVSADHFTMTPFIGSHEHYNWGFTTNGLYRVTFRCTGRRLGETTNIIGQDVAWAFQLLPLRPWEAWIATNWLPATDATLAGPAADPEGDGIVNLLEYAFGNDPHTALRTNLPRCLLVTADDTTYGALQFTHSLNATDVELAVAASSALTDPVWTPLTNVFSVTTNGPLETITVRDIVPAHTGSRFYQLRARLLYP